MTPTRFPLAWPALAAACLLSACANLAPPYQRPAAAVADAWPGSTAVTTAASPAGSTAALPDWRSVVLDARLRDAIDLALQNNRSLRQQVLAVAQARATYQVQDAATGPTVRATASATASRSPAEASSSGQATQTRNLSVGLGTAAWEIEFFGRLQNLSDAALDSYLATEQAQRSAELALVASVAQAWLGLGADQAQLALARHTLASQQQTLALTRQRQQLGADSGLTLAQVQTSVETARRDVAALQAQVQQDRNALTLLLGTALPEALEPSTATLAGGEGTASEPTQVPAATALVAVPAELPATVLQRRPDVLAAEHALKAAHANIGAARAARYPNISLTSSVGTASRDLGSLFKGGAWSFVPSINLPIFDGGASAAAVTKAEVAQQIQLAAYDQAVQTAFREVADALAVRASLAERLDAQQGVVSATARSHRLATARWQAGAASHLEVLDAQRSLYAAQQALITLRLAEQTNRVTLYKVLGG